MMPVIAYRVHRDRLFPDAEWMAQFEQLFAIDAEQRSWDGWSHCLMDTLLTSAVDVGLLQPFNGTPAPLSANVDRVQYRQAANGPTFRGALPRDRHSRYGTSHDLTAIHPDEPRRHCFVLASVGL
jgi:hypothetical protein